MKSMIKSTLRTIATCALSIGVLGSLGGWHDQEAWGAALATGLAPAGSAARLYFAAPCLTTQGAAGELVYPTFPRITLVHNPADASGPQTVKKILRNERDTVVSVDQTGMTRITVGTVPSDFLNTKISQVAFGPMEQWNPSEAISAIERTSEVARSMHALDVGPMIGTIRIEMILTGPGSADSKVPHLPPLLRNVTMDQALDAVARTFRQLVTYGVCVQANGHKVFHIDYTPLIECGTKSYYYSCFEPESARPPGPLELSPLPSSSP
jgi:hypothetical protein